MVFTEKRHALIEMEFIDFNIWQAKNNSEYRVGLLFTMKEDNSDSAMKFYLAMNIDKSIDLDFRALQYLVVVERIVKLTS